MRRSPSPRELTIRSDQKTETEIMITVEDQRTGIPDEHLATIFEPFFTTMPEGTGMGLAICSSIVETHDGRLWAESLPAGGAAFHFTVRTQS